MSESTLPIAESPVVPGSAASLLGLEISRELETRVVEPKPSKGACTALSHLPPEALSPPEQNTNSEGRIDLSLALSLSLSLPPSFQKSLLAA